MKQGATRKALDGVLRPGGLKLTARMLEYCAFTPGARILDIGCGAGITVNYLCDTCGFDAVGLDSSAAAFSRQGCSQRFYVSNAECMPFEAASFDGAMAECSLSVMKYKGEILDEINRILLPGGKLAISDLYLKEGISPLPGTIDRHSPSCLSGALTKSGLTGILKEHGFKTLCFEDHSYCIPEFLARYIMEYGALEECWQCGQDKKKFGYFLLVAEKTS